MLAFVVGSTTKRNPMEEPDGQASLNPIHVFIAVLEDSTAALKMVPAVHDTLNGPIRYLFIMHENVCTAALEMLACKHGFLSGLNHEFSAIRRGICTTALEKGVAEDTSSSLDVVILKLSSPSLDTFAPRLWR